MVNFILINNKNMALSVGIVGLPNVGKSTLFNALTKNSAPSSNYPFCTIDPNIGIVSVSDYRLGKLAKISKPEKIIPCTIEFIDIAGLVKGAHKGEGLGNKFLSHIRECDAICEVVRNFQDDNIVHVNGKVDPIQDRETINLELIFADLNTVEKRLASITKEARGHDKEAVKMQKILRKLKAHLGQGKAIRELELNQEEKILIKELNLLSIKPIIYVLNGNDNSKIINKKWDGEILFLNAKLGAEIAELLKKEQKEYIREFGIDKSDLDKLIQACYRLLNLITYFTTGPKETRAWTIERGTLAPQAAGKIHTDFESGFIRAEVISYKDFIRAGGEAKAREKGLLRTEGKNYEIKDGDVCHFLVNR